MLLKSLGSEERLWAMASCPYLGKFYFSVLLLSLHVFFLRLKHEEIPVVREGSPLSPYSPYPFSSAPICLAPTLPSSPLMLEETESAAPGRRNLPSLRRGSWAQSSCFPGKLPVVLLVGAHLKGKSSAVSQERKKARQPGYLHLFKMVQGASRSLSQAI